MTRKHKEDPPDELTREQREAILKAREEKNQEHFAKLNEDRRKANVLRTRPAQLAFQPIPVNAFPAPCADFIADGARAIGCDPSYIALPLLSGLAAAIGNSRIIQLKPSWSEPCIIWTGIIGDSGSMKSPALEAPLNPVYKKNSEQIEIFNEQFAGYEQAKEKHDAEMQAWKQRQKQPKYANEQPPQSLWKPTCERYWCEDVTTEALVDRLKDCPRGVLLARDELSGFLAGLDQYKSGKGADAAHFLKMHGARTVIVDRKTGDKPTTCVRRASVSITGGIQPGILRDLIGREHFENGMLARFILTNPPRQPKQWTDAYINPDLQNRLGDLYAKLWALETPVDALGHLVPVPVPLTSKAKAVFVDFFNRHANEQASLTGDLSAAWSKLEGYCPRISLVHHFASWANGETAPDAIGEASMLAAVQLVEWACNETRRVYATLSETDDQRDQRKRIELIERKGGRITPRELQAGERSFRDDAGAAEKALDDLVKAGFGLWEERSPSPQGGRASRVFWLFQSVSSQHNPENAAGIEGYADADTSGEEKVA